MTPCDLVGPSYTGIYFTLIAFAGDPPNVAFLPALASPEGAAFNRAGPAGFWTDIMPFIIALLWRISLWG